MIWPLIDNAISVPLFGTRLTVLGMALGGGVFSYAYGKREPNRKRMFIGVLAGMFLGTVAVVVIPAWLEMSWVTPLIEGPLAGAFGFIARFAIPLCIEVAPEWVRGRYITAPQQAPAELAVPQTPEGDAP